MKSIPLIVQFIGTMIIVFVSIWFGYQVGRIFQQCALILALSFSLVIWIISNFDELQSKYFQISQQPFTDLQSKFVNYWIAFQCLSLDDFIIQKS